MSSEGNAVKMNHAEQAKEILCAYLVDSTRRKEAEDIGQAVDCIIAAAVEAMKAERSEFSDDDVIEECPTLRTGVTPGAELVLLRNRIVVLEDACRTAKVALCVASFVLNDKPECRCVNAAIDLCGKALRKEGEAAT